ncbi:restriction endonuclease subunit S, partial [Xanthobacter oligotrophicus]|uniref:restriction endonuclease subunit S n=1 Tax=Xanthobacter oligotrophicus TaxID=2607286 RepID=UPI001AEF2732
VRLASSVSVIDGLYPNLEEVLGLRSHGGVGLQHVTRSMVDRLQIPLPPLDEQKRIAAILDKADALRRKRRQALALLDSLPESIFLEMFGRANCVAKKMPLNDVCSVIRDGAHATPKYVETGIPFVTVSHITGGSLSFNGAKFVSVEARAELTRRVKPERGDILVSKDGAIGVPCLVDTDDEFGIFVSIFLLNSIKYQGNSTFLAAQLCTEGLQWQIRKSSKEISMRHLHLADFRKLQILIPPLELQENFSRKFNKIRKRRRKMRGCFAQFDSLFASLQHRAFTGQL